MASLASSIRSAAQATSSAYRRLPIRWRLAGGSAVLTLVILCGFATIVGVLTTQSIEANFNREVRDAADKLEREVRLKLVETDRGPAIRQEPGALDYEDFAAGQRDAAVRVIVFSAPYVLQTRNAPDLGPPRPGEPVEADGWRVETREILVAGAGSPTCVPPPPGCACSWASACSAARSSPCSPAWPPRGARCRRSPS